MMTRRFYGTFRIILFIASVLSAPQPTWSGTLTVGSISIYPAQEIKKFLPFSKYLAGELKSEGIDQGKVVVAGSISEMAGLIRERKVDIYMDSPFPAIAVSRLTGSKLLLRRWKGGSAEYHSVVFAQKESAISRLEDLKGKIIAFDRPFSSSGYLLPKMSFAQSGLKLKLVPRDAGPAPLGPSEVGYLFSNDDENTMFWVLRGKVAAGAMDNQSYVSEAKGDIGRLRIAHKTFSVPRQILTLRADLAPGLAARIKEILTGMDRSDAGKKTLQEFERTTRFDELPLQSLSALSKVREYVASDPDQK